MIMKVKAIEYSFQKIFGLIYFVLSFFCVLNIDLYSCDIDLITLIGSSLKNSDSLQKQLYNGLYSFVCTQVLLANNLNNSEVEEKNIHELKTKWQNINSIVKDNNLAYSLEIEVFINELEKNVRNGELIVAHNILQKIYISTIYIAQNVIGCSLDIKKAVKLWLFVKECIEKIHHDELFQAVEICKKMHKEVTNICGIFYNKDEEYYNIITKALNNIILNENHISKEEFLLKISIINESLKKILEQLYERYKPNTKVINEGG